MSTELTQTAAASDPLLSNDVEALRAEIRRLRELAASENVVDLRMLWEQLRSAAPEIFAAGHVPTVESFRHLCEAMAELISAAMLSEAHVHQMLRDLRQVSDENDKLNHFYIMLTKNAGLAQTLRDFLVGGKRMGNFTHLLRAEQAWAQALASGLYKLVVRAPALIAQELNPRSWQYKRGPIETDDAAVGRHFRETVARDAPEALGTTFRKQAGSMSYEDYNDLMKRQ